MEIFDYIPESCRDLYDHWEPVIFHNQLNLGSYWIFFLFIILLVLLYEEINYNIPTLELEGKSKKRLIDYVLSKVRNNHIVDINWRTSLVSALVISFILSYFLFYPFEVPPGFVYFFLVIIIWGITYFSLNWVTSHCWKMNDYKIEDNLLKLRNDLKTDIKT